MADNQKRHSQKLSPSKLYKGAVNTMALGTFLALLKPPAMAASFFT